MIGIAAILTNIEAQVGVDKLTLDYEVVERKGVGHPDTLADALGEHLSRNYSLYTRERVGAILHHNFDKTGLLGGTSYVEFGKGMLTKPIRVLLNGRASMKFAGEDLDIRSKLEKWAVDFLCAQFPQLRRESDVMIHFNLSTASSPGAVTHGTQGNARHKWFEPQSLDDLSELRRLHSNDTSLGVGYAPLSPLERTILEIEDTLNSADFKQTHPWIGSDIKIMGNRVSGTAGITLCVPQLAEHVRSLEEYQRNLAVVQDLVSTILHRHLPNSKNSVGINTRDNFQTRELYLTAIGSSIESGDEGLVGRGNRITGLISSTRPMSMEGVCGKNPVYHIGKLYYVAAQRIAEKIHGMTEKYCEVFLISQSGRDLIDPWKVIISIADPSVIKGEVKDAVEEEIANMPRITEILLAGQIRLY